MRRLIAIFTIAGALACSLPAQAARHHRWHRRHEHHQYHHHHLRPRAGHPNYWLFHRAAQPSQSNPIEAAVHEIGSGLVGIMRRFLGQSNPTGFRGPWCGAQLALAARLGGYSVPSGYLQASAWVHAGQRLSRPIPGAIAVWSHHVGVVTQWPRIISGNWGHRVAEGVQHSGRFLGFYAPHR